MNYDGHLHTVYPQGRALSAEATQVWSETFARWADPRRPQTVLDLGSGTGRFTPMFLVLHHVGDRKAAAAEIRRVLRPGGRVLVRSTFADRMPDLLWHRYFPRARVIEQQMFPSYVEAQELFSSVGTRVVALDQVRQQFAASLDAYTKRLELRAISIFEYLTEDEITRGVADLRAGS